jgi:hypothetical protein
MAKDGLISEELRKVLLDDLRAQRESAEGDIKELCERRIRVYEEVNSENRRSVPTQEIDSVEAIYNGMFVKLKKINIRIEQIKSPDFSIKCPSCSGEMAQEYMKAYPLREVCQKCLTISNRRR